MKVKVLTLTMIAYMALYSASITAEHKMGVFTAILLSVGTGLLVVLAWTLYAEHRKN